MQAYGHFFWGVLSCAGFARLSMKLAVFGRFPRQWCRTKRPRMEKRFRATNRGASPFCLRRRSHDLQLPPAAPAPAKKQHRQSPTKHALRYPCLHRTYTIHILGNWYGDWRVLHQSAKIRGEAWPKPLISPQIPLHVSDSPLITGPGMSPWVKNADVCLRQVFCTTASMLRLPTSSCKEEEETRHARRYPHPFGRNISKGRPVKARTDPLQAAVRRFVPFATCPADPPDLGQGISESQHGATLLFSTAAASITSASQKLHLGMV